MTDQDKRTLTERALENAAWLDTMAEMANDPEDEVGFRHVAYTLREAAAALAPERAPSGDVERLQKLLVEKWSHEAWALHQMGARGDEAEAFGRCARELDEALDALRAAAPAEPAEVVRLASELVEAIEGRASRDPFTITADLKMVLARIAAPTKPTKDGSNLLDAVEMAWVIIANVSGGDLTMQSQDWQGAVRRWADEWLPVLGKGLQARTLAIPAEGREVEP